MKICSRGLCMGCPCGLQMVMWKENVQDSMGLWKTVVLCPIAVELHGDAVDFYC